MDMVTGQLADTPTRRLPTRRLDDSRTGQVADWTTRTDDFECLVFVLLAASARPRVGVSASCPVTMDIGPHSSIYRSSSSVLQKQTYFCLTNLFWSYLKENLQR